MDTIIANPNGIWSEQLFDKWKQLIGESVIWKPFKAVWHFFWKLLFSFAEISNAHRIKHSYIQSNCYAKGHCLWVFLHIFWNVVQFAFMKLLML